LRPLNSEARGEPEPQALRLSEALHSSKWFAEKVKTPEVAYTA